MHHWIGEEEDYTNGYPDNGSGRENEDAGQGKLQITYCISFDLILLPEIYNIYIVKIIVESLKRKIWKMASPTVHNHPRFQALKIDMMIAPVFSAPN